MLLPTFYTGTHIRNEGFIGKNRVLNPNKYFIISINMFGNGLSSSPSNSKKNQQGSKFPTVTLWDNINCQHKLIVEKLKIKKIALVTGWSMAGCQSYQWAAQYPNMVKSILPFCASSKTSIHNHVFLEGVKSALTAVCKRQILLLAQSKSVLCLINLDALTLFLNILLLEITQP